MDSRGGGVRHRGTATTALARGGTAHRSSLRNRRHEHTRAAGTQEAASHIKASTHRPRDHLTAMRPPFLRREQLGHVEGSLAFLCG